MIYEITEDTLAILSEGYLKTRIVEKNRDFYIYADAHNILNQNCEYYGSTYSGRAEAAKNMLNCSYKIPVLIEESRKTIFFPTKSIFSVSCSWINYNYIKKCDKCDKNTVITFNNDKTIMVEESVMVIENQILRAGRLQSIIISRENRKKEY